MILVIAAESPVDEHGRLLHAGDVAAQLALTVTKVDRAVRDAGLAMSDLTRLRIRTTDATALHEAIDVLTEHLAACGATPPVTVVEVEHLDDPEMVVAIDGLADR